MTKANNISNTPREWTWTNKDIQFSNNKLYTTELRNSKVMRNRRIRPSAVVSADHIVVTSTDLRQWVVTDEGRQQGRVPELDLGTLYRLGTYWDKGRGAARLARYKLAEKNAPVVDGKSQIDKKLLKQLKIPFYIARGRNPIKEWCQAVGWDNIKLVKGFNLKLQGALLQAVVRVDGFKDLLTSNPLLAVSVINSIDWHTKNSGRTGRNIVGKGYDAKTVVFKGDRLAWIRRLVKMKQHLIVKKLHSETCQYMDMSAIKKATKLTRKISSCDLCLDHKVDNHVRHILEITKSPESVKLINHLPKLSLTILDLIYRSSNGHATTYYTKINFSMIEHAYLVKLSTDSRRAVRYHTKVGQAFEFLNDASRITWRLEQKGFPVPQPKLTNLIEVKAWHDEVMKMWDHLQHANYALPAAPVPSIEGITHLDTAHKLRDEGREMHHCVGSYDSLVKEGHSAIYHVERDGETATLELRKSKQTTYHVQGVRFENVVQDTNSWVLSQLHGVCNKSVSSDLELMVNMWLKKSQRQEPKSIKKIDGRSIHQPYVATDEDITLDEQREANILRNREEAEQWARDAFAPERAANNHDDDAELQAYNDAIPVLW